MLTGFSTKKVSFCPYHSTLKLSSHSCHLLWWEEMEKIHREPVAEISLEIIIQGHRFLAELVWACAKRRWLIFLSGAGVTQLSPQILQNKQEKRETVPRTKSINSNNLNSVVQLKYCLVGSEETCRLPFTKNTQNTWCYRRNKQEAFLCYLKWRY